MPMRATDLTTRHLAAVLPEHVSWELPWLRLQRVFRVLLRTDWDDASWPHARVLIVKAALVRMELRQAGWFN